MNSPIKILHLEDEPHVENVVKSLLDSENLSYNLKRVDTEEKFVSEFSDDNYDLIIADYSLPHYNGLSALEAVRNRNRFIPFILFSGAIGEDMAIECLKRGATDYVLKQQPSKLVPAIKRAITERDQRLEREKVKKALQESELKFRSIFETTHDAVVLLDKNLNIIAWNYGAKNIFGYDESEILGQPVIHLLTPDTINCHHEDIAQYFELIIGQTVELQAVRKNKEIFPVELSLSSWETDKGTYYSAIVRDILRRKTFERQLMDSETRYRTLVETMLDGVCIYDFEEKLLYVNRAFCNLLGYSEKQLLGRKLSELIVEEDREKNKQETAFRLKGQYGVYELRMRTRKGEKKSFLISASPYVEEYQNIKGILAVLHDITDRKEREIRLKKAREESEKLLSSMSTVLIGIDRSDTVIRWNKAAEEIFGIPASQVIGKPFLKCGIQWDWNKILERIANIREKNILTRWEDIVYTRPNGREGFLSVVVNPLLDEHQKYGGFILVATEVTERKNLEVQLAGAQKLESIGQLAAGIAHEINTPIQYVGDNIRFIQDAFSDLRGLFDKFKVLLNGQESSNGDHDIRNEIKELMEQVEMDWLLEEIPRAVEQSLEGTQRVTDIVRAMKEFSHPGREEKSVIDLNKALKNTLTVSRNEWKYVAEVETDFDANLPAVACLPGEMNQVFLNIIINAAHAIKEVVGEKADNKGKIRVSTHQVGEMVEIRISDNGTGIPKSIQSKIFDPFFTTKDVGKGTGQGLALSYNIVVEKHGGSISFESEMGKGTTFIIRLPIKAKKGGDSC
ncbi:MAG: hypothetical protein Kow0042_27350 [Calditrichia bacterium]